MTMLKHWLLSIGWWYHHRLVDRHNNKHPPGIEDSKLLLCEIFMVCFIVHFYFLLYLCCSTPFYNFYNFSYNVFRQCACLSSCWCYIIEHYNHLIIQFYDSCCQWLQVNIHVYENIVKVKQSYRFYVAPF